MQLLLNYFKKADWSVKYIYVYFTEITQVSKVGDPEQIVYTKERNHRSGISS